MRADHVQPGVGHYGVFNGSRFRKEIQPRMAEFICAHDRSRSAKIVPFVRAERKIA
jgi:poly-beta-hydroxyalkanoate depolymerase